MGKYFGRIDIIGSYYNFMPLYVINGDDIRELNSDDYYKLLPKSERHNINFSFDINISQEDRFMSDFFHEDLPVILEFDTKDLELNYDRQGNLQMTGYRIRTHEQFDQGKITDAYRSGIYQLVSQSNLSSDPLKDSIIVIDDSHVYEGTEIYISLDRENIVVGPYKVEYREQDGALIARSKFREHNYILSGYTRNACRRLFIDNENDDIVYIMPNKGAVRKYIDIIDDRTLLDSFREYVSGDVLDGNTLNLSDIDKAVDFLKNTPFITSIDDNKIGEQRLERIRSLFNFSGSVDKTIKIASEIGASLVDLLENYKAPEFADRLAYTIAKSNPDLIGSVMQNTGNGEKAEVISPESWNARRRQTSLTPEEIAEIEAAEENAGVNRLKAEKESIKEEIRKARRELNLTGDIRQLEQKIDRNKKTVEYYSDQINELKDTLKTMDKQLADTQKLSIERIGEMQINELLAARLRDAAVDWNRRQKEEEFDALTGSMSAVKSIDMEVDELLDYLCSAIGDARPQYDRNFIINIMTCVCQNMLTVFSGAPGCGKTSICNIIG